MYRKKIYLLNKKNNLNILRIYILLNIYYFNPNYILISYHIAKVVNNIIDLIKGEPEKLYSLIFFVLQFFKFNDLS